MSTRKKLLLLVAFIVLGVLSFKVTYSSTKVTVAIKKTLGNPEVVRHTPNVVYSDVVWDEAWQFDCDSGGVIVKFSHYDNFIVTIDGKTVRPIRYSDDYYQIDEQTISCGTIMWTQDEPVVMSYSSNVSFEEQKMSLFFIVSFIETLGLVLTIVAVVGAGLTIASFT